jgi:molybdopterin molybdotransferase
MERDRAKKIILNSVIPLGVERVTVDNAFGRVLGEEIRAKFDIPEKNKSAIDGYTFKLDSIESSPVTLKIVGESRAGVPFERELKKGEAVFTMTGAVVPDGADVAVRVEDVEVKNGYVKIFKQPKRWELINLEGEEVKSGQKILGSGVELDYRLIALLVNMGYYQIGVYSRPKIGIIVTGDEVKEAWIDSDRAGVKNSNYFILKGILSKYADVRYYGVVQDEIDKMIPLFRQALRENDILLSSGGASKGKYDFTKDIASRLGLNIKFTSTNIKPGRPLIFATSENGLFFGLPGYPSALLTNLLEFLLPAVKKLSGCREFSNITLKGVAEEDFKSKLGRVDFIRTKISYKKDGRVSLLSAGTQQTSNFLTMAFADGLIIADESSDGVRKGDVVEVLKLG